MKEQYLEEKLKQWIEINGKLPNKDDMKVREGYPRFNHFFKVLKLKKWSEVLNYFGYVSTFKTWSNKEIRTLINNWEVHSDEEIAKKLNRTVNAVSAMRKSYGLLRQSKKQSWKQWEVNYLINNFYEEEQTVIEETLSHRKWETIRAYATKQLKLKRKNRLYKYQLGDGKRRCDTCNSIFPETKDFYYTDGSSYRTKCINCYNEHQEKIAREKGVLTRKLKQEKFNKGLARCSKCNEWKLLNQFRMSYNDMRSIRRYCIECDKKYLREYNLRKRFGEDYEWMYELEKADLKDFQGTIWDSKEEVFIANKLLQKGYKVKKGLPYKEVFDFDKSRRRFDFLIDIDGQPYHIEYFGLWSVKSNYRKRYVKNAKRKIKLLYKYRDDFNFIMLFPIDLNRIDIIFDNPKLSHLDSY